MNYYFEDNIDRVRRDMEDAERGMAGMERHMDRLEQENSDLRRSLTEANLEISRLQASPMPLSVTWTKEALAQRFHETYERLAPEYG